MLIPCYSLANGKGMEGDPNEINCIVNKYIAKFPKWRKTFHNYKYCPWDWLVKDNIIESSQFISFEDFVISGDKDNGDCFWIEIWTMKSSIDAKRLFKFLKEGVGVEVPKLWSPPLSFYKPPKEFFVFENYFIWVNACSSTAQFDVYDELDKIIKMCFE
jgi:hypothetical protein